MISAASFSLAQRKQEKEMGNTPGQDIASGAVAPLPSGELEAEAKAAGYADAPSDAGDTHLPASESDELIGTAADAGGGGGASPFTVLPPD